ncbi:hypothetical protein GPECTOR_5g104 [Gonium pectorale]|uniref:Uncharacterized protein n=1 Tax=Gonium pectorale TaxID=33097 RepID=A0A150GWB3_GONPE|nr:hypothetical protein GPECTOR_5g104 [Gonium pectorale]|eukprot:KXZ53992.1 hypothetical protein GPECTOR_5g104 [Gonium pectorale]
MLCFQARNPLPFAVQLRLTPELKQALINARAVGEPVSLRFREEPQREAVMSIGNTEYVFSSAPAAGQLEVLELAPKARGATAVAAIRQRLTLQRAADSDARPRGLAGSLAGGVAEDRKKRSAVLLDGGQRGAAARRGAQATQSAHAAPG